MNIILARQMHANQHADSQQKWSEDKVHANVQMLSEGTSSKTATNSMHQLLGPRPTPHQLTQPCSLAVAMDDAPDKYFIH